MLVRLGIQLKFIIFRKYRMLNENRKLSFISTNLEYYSQEIRIEAYSNSREGK
jgi:hypothetical protein